VEYGYRFNNDIVKLYSIGDICNVALYFIKSGITNSAYQRTNKNFILNILIAVLYKLHYGKSLPARHHSLVECFARLQFRRAAAAIPAKLVHSAYLNYFYNFSSVKTNKKQNLNVKNSSTE